MSDERSDLCGNQTAARDFTHREKSPRSRRLDQSAWMVLRRSASRMDMVIVAVVVTIAALRIQELDKGNDATFLFGPNATLLFGAYIFNRHNVSYV